jgi:lysylphosphatidylglycerol synthetase-like protein (DUF2156 family)
VFVVRRPATPVLLAWFAAAAGLISIISALTPEMADRVDLIRGVLPPGVPDAARTVSLALGLGLVWLARGLARRKRRAWWLAVVVVFASAVAHLAKGLDFEESATHILFLIALVRARREFVAPGDPTTIRPLVQVGAALTVCLPVALVYAYDNDAFSERIEEALLIVIGGLAIRAAWLWFRPFRVEPQESSDLARATDLVQAHGTDSLAYFALRRDKSYFFSASGRTFLAYRVVAGTALVAGDPIGETRERHDLMAEFRRVAHAKGWRVAIAGAANDALADYADLGFKSIYLGDEAVIRPSEFSLDGRPIRKVRQSVSRLEKCGYQVRVLSTADADPHLREELHAVSQEWRGNWPERGFTMAMDALFRYPDTVLAVAVAPDGAVGGFLQLVPSPASEGYSLASMRRRRDTPNGLMEYLITETVAWGREHNVTEISLNFAVFADFLRADEDAALWTRGLRWALLKGDRLFQVERLHSFNRKFFPHWRRRYFCFERWGDLPLAGLAYLHAESLLTPPGPWVKTPDLAAQ